MLENYNDVLKPDDVCKILLVGKGTLFKLLDSGVLKGYKSGKNWRITKQAVINYLKSMSEGVR